MSCLGRVRRIFQRTNCFLICILVTTLLYVQVDGQTNGDVRLTGGGPSGRIEVFYNSQWGVVCHDHFNHNVGLVVCRQLNLLTTPTVTEYQRSGVPITLHYITCVGSETKLSDCSIPHYGVAQGDNCTQNKEAGVICGTTTTTVSAVMTSSTTTAPPEGSLRLTSGTSSVSGRLELQRSGSWGTICASSFGLNEAKVACKHLGKIYDKVTVKTPAYYGQGSGNIWKLRCSGNETKVTDCKVSVGSGICSSHDQDVGIICGVDENNLPQITPEEGSPGFDYFYFVIPVVVAGAIAWVIYLRCNRKARLRRQRGQHGEPINVTGYGRVRNVFAVERERERQLKIQQQMRTRNRALQSRNSQVHNDETMNDPWYPNPGFGNVQYIGRGNGQSNPDDRSLTPVESNCDNVFNEPAPVFSTEASRTNQVQESNGTSLQEMRATTNGGTNPQQQQQPRFFHYPQNQPRLPAYATEFDSPYPPSYDDLFGNSQPRTANTHF